MKIEQSDGFKPITITLESEAEAAVLATALAGTAGNKSGNDLLYRIYAELDNMVDWRAQFTYHGNLSIQGV